MYAGGRTPWGWHCLTAEWAHLLVQDAGIRPGDLVLDLGAGTGALTAPLLEAGAHVIAVELHPGRAAQLRRRFAGDPLTVVEVDLADFRLPRRPFSVVANPPFALTSPLISALTGPHSSLRGAHLVLQRATARRWADGRAGRAGLRCRYDLQVRRLLPRSAFRPRPSVDTAVLAITRR